jgi:3-isopropylmalate/(R)-2-methylmalate dehydratase small subunit
VQAPERAMLTVDLHQQTIVTSWGERVDFEVDPSGRQALLEGLDPIDMTLKGRASIEAFEAQQRLERPWIWEA